jgi:O-antigen/teichoic acid export membrane protein
MTDRADARLPGKYLATLRDIGLTSGARAYSTILSMIALALTARWLGPEGRGIGVVVITWVGLVSTVTYLSLGQVCVHRAAREDHMEWLGPAVAALLWFTAIASIVGWAAAALFYSAGHSISFAGIPLLALAIGFAALPFMIWEQYGSALMSVIGRVGTYNISQVVARTIGLGLLAITILGLGWGVYGFIIASTVAQMIVSSISLGVLLRHARGRLAGGFKTVGMLIRDGVKVHLNSIGVLLFSGVDILMLNAFRGPAEAALFQLPNQLFLAMLLVPQSALLILQSRVSGSSLPALWEEQRMIMALVVAGMAGIALALWLLAPFLIPLLGSSQFEESIPVFRILLFAAPVAAFNTMMGLQWIVRGYFLRVSLITFAAGLLNCGLNLILIPRMGADGAALASAAGIFAFPLIANLILAIRAEQELKSARHG